MMTRLSLPASVDLPAAMRLADALRAIAGPILLDGADVERIGVAGLQLLLSAQSTAQAGGHTFAIERPSAALAAAARTAGAAQRLAIAEGSFDAA